MAEETLATMVTVADCRTCVMARALLEDVVRDNPALTVHWVDVDEEPAAVRSARALSHPTLVVTVGGDEALRMSGPMSQRRLLRKLLPVLYPEPAESVAQLRRQLGTAGETFPGIVRGRVTQDRRIELLRAVPLFSELDKRHLRALARLVDEVSVGEGQELIHQGDEGDEFFVLLEGRARVDRDGAVIAQLGAGDCFGEMSLLDDGPRSASVTATAEATLLTLHRADFERMLDANPSVSRALLRHLSGRIRAERG